MDRPFPILNRRRAGRPLTTGLTCALLLVGGCQDASQVAQQETDTTGKSAVPHRFEAPDDVRPVAQFASHLQISEPDDNVISNPFTDLNRVPPVTDRARRSQAVAVPSTSSVRETPALDGLGLPFRLEKSTSAKKSAPSENLVPSEHSSPSRQPQPAARPASRRELSPRELSPVEIPLQLNPPKQASAQPTAAPVEKSTAEQFLASLAPSERPLQPEALQLEPPPFTAPQFARPQEESPAIQPNDVPPPETPAESGLPEIRKYEPGKMEYGESESRVENPALAHPPQRAEPRDPKPVVFPPQMPPITTVSQAPTAEDRALLAVRGRMNSLVDQGLILAQRGAYFSARAEFIQALRLATQTLDTAQSTHRHSEALAEAIAALEEAGDFIPSGARLEANVDLELVISSHRTSILRDAAVNDLTALTAAQRYFTFAQEKLAIACGGLPEASRALVGLGRIQEHLYDTTGDNRTLIGPRSMALYQSALVVNGKNYEAANELGVLLARYGQFDDAKQALLQGAEASSRPEIWANLASIHETLGEADLARRARIEADQARQFAQAQNALDAVRWISPEEMAAHGRGDAELKQARPRPADSEAPVAQKRPTASWWAR